MSNLNPHDILNLKSDYGKRLTQAIESAYNLRVLDYSPIPEISFTSKKALITTDQGVLFLKEKPFYSKGSGELFRSSTFQDYCAKNSQRFVGILKTKDGRHFLDFEGSIYFITPFADGKSFNGKTEDLLKILATIVELQHLGKKYLEENTNTREYLPENKSYDIVLPFSLLEPMITTNGDRETLNNLKKALGILIEEYNSFANIEYIMSHGDCILFNFQISGEVAILHDFDNAKVLPNIHDIAEFFVSSCLINYSGSVTNLKLPIFLSCHKETSDIMAKEILKHLKTGEEKLLPICIEIIWLWTLMLSVIKEDHKITDLVPAIQNISERKLHGELVEIFNS
ncbi:MAG: hypothetical protein AAB821_02690 [Patescibacteria group bacterium]